MIKERVQDAINEQINKEFYSAYLYLSMAEYFEAKSLNGLAHWFFVQHQEEVKHAQKFISYLNERGGRVVLKAIQEPKFEWKGVGEVFEDTYSHERFITESIENIMKIAIEENDFATQNLLNWFIDEQVEEEKNSFELIEKIKFVGVDGYAIYMLDKELGARGA